MMSNLFTEHITAYLYTILHAVGIATHFSSLSPFFPDLGGQSGVMAYQPRRRRDPGEGGGSRDETRWPSSWRALPRTPAWSVEGGWAQLSGGHYGEVVNINFRCYPVLLQHLEEWRGSDIGDPNLRFWWGGAPTGVAGPIQTEYGTSQGLSSQHW